MRSVQKSSRVMTIEVEEKGRERAELSVLSLHEKRLSNKVKFSGRVCARRAFCLLDTSQRSRKETLSRSQKWNSRETGSGEDSVALL